MNLRESSFRPWMPESSDKDVNSPTDEGFASSLSRTAAYRPWLWIPALPAGMTERIAASRFLVVNCLTMILCTALWANTAAAEPKNGQDAAMQQVLRKAQGVVRQLTQDKAALEAEKAALTAEKAALEEKVRKLEEALKPLEALPAEVARCKADTESLRSAKTNLESQLGQGREQAQALLKKHQEVIAKARDIRADNLLLVEAVKEREQWIEQCGKRNRDLVGTGRELAEKYKDKSFWDELGDLEPLTGIGKVKSETAAEEYRYRLQRLKATPFEGQAPLPGERPAESAPAEADGEAEQ
jgi:myosin heavy subunit